MTQLKINHFGQNGPIFSVYDLLLLEQVNALNLVAALLQVSETVLAERGRNKIIVF
jgi:hypothetical protein